MNLDRVENRTHVRRRFPRYHTSLFRGQALWDPYTHVILPPAALVSRQQQQQHSWKEKERLEKERKAANFRKKKSLRLKASLTRTSSCSSHLPSESFARAGWSFSQSHRGIHGGQTSRVDARAAHHHRHHVDLPQSGRRPSAQVPRRPTGSEVGINHSEHRLVGLDLDFRQMT